MDLDELEFRIHRANRAIDGVKALVIQKAIARFATQSDLRDPVRVACIIAMDWDEREVLEDAARDRGWLGLAEEWLRHRRKEEIQPPRP